MQGSRCTDTDSDDLVSSLLLPTVFEGYEPAEPLTVLDVGSGKSSTLNFLTQYHTHVVFCDLFAQETTTADADATDAERENYALEVLQKALEETAINKIDVCLFWDYLHHLDRPSLRAFSAALGPYLSRDSRGYAFGAPHTHTPLDQNEYSIHDVRHLARKPSPTSRAAGAHSQKVLSEHFGAFTIIKGTLLREGRLELYLEAN